MTKYFRQGDICFKRVDKVPEGLERKGTVLEIRGEREGHIHRMNGVQVLVPPEQKEQLPMFIVVATSTAVMVHPEHQPLAIPEGEYEITQFQEYQNPQAVD